MKHFQDLNIYGRIDNYANESETTVKQFHVVSELFRFKCMLLSETETKLFQFYFFFVSFVCPAVEEKISLSTTARRYKFEQRISICSRQTTWDSQHFNFPDFTLSSTFLRKSAA